MIDQQSYETFSLAKYENACWVGRMIRCAKNPENIDLWEILTDLIPISTEHDAITYNTNNSLLIDIEYQHPNVSRFNAKGPLSVNLLLMKYGHPLSIKIDQNNFRDDEKSTLLIDQAIKDNKYYIAAKLLDYASPLPTSIADKSISSLKNLYFCADEQDFAQKRRTMRVSSFNMVRMQQLGKQAASRYNRMHQKKSAKKAH